MTQTSSDILARIKNSAVAYVGRLASMTPEEFAGVIHAHGGQVAIDKSDAVSLLIVGQQSWPIGPDGTLPEPLVRELKNRNRPAATILSEEQFVLALGLQERQEVTGRLYTLATLADLLKVTRQRITFWIRAGLIRAVKVDHGIGYFDFRQVSAAQTLVELTKSGVPFDQLRRSLEQLKTWLPEAAQPLEQMALLEEHGKLLVRVGDEDLAEPDGQFHFDFTEVPPPMPLHSPFLSAPFLNSAMTASQWHAQGKDQQQNGMLSEAAESFRQALLLSGPDPDVCFDLAFVLSLSGKKEQAAERYRQTVEMNPKHPDAWNNLGVILAETGEQNDACTAFHRAIALNPGDLRAHYNLADTLEDMGMHEEAIPHWQAYLRMDKTSPWAAHARRQLKA